MQQFAITTTEMNTTPCNGSWEQTNIKLEWGDFGTDQREFGANLPNVFRDISEANYLPIVDLSASLVKSSSPSVKGWMTTALVTAVSVTLIAM